MEHRNPKRVTLRNTSLRPLSEMEIVDATRMFANGTKLVIKGLAPPGLTGRDVYDRFLRLKAEQNILDLSTSEGSRDEAIAFTNLQTRIAYERDVTPEQFRAILRERIHAAISLSLTDPEAAANMVLQGNIIEGLTYKCPDVNYAFSGSPGGLRLTHQFLITGLVDLVHFGLILLLDETRDFRKKLCKCQWGPCGLLFFEVKPPTGRPQRKYCGEEHMLSAHQSNAAGRMRKRRRASVGRT